MKTRVLLALSIIGLLFSCDIKRDETAQYLIDSLSIELQTSNQLTEQMVEVSALIDSIDASRKLLRTDMIEGTNYENFAARLNDINAYVKRTQTKMNDLERTIRSNNAAHQRAIKKLKNDLEVRSDELVALAEQVKLYKNENGNLITTVDLQKAEIQNKLEQIKVKQGETAKLEEQINQLIIKSKLDEGEAYYVRAMAVEETANRTQFAPRKKKNTIKEAIELYKMAQANGKDGAQAKVDQLEKRLGKSYSL